MPLDSVIADLDVIQSLLLDWSDDDVTLDQHLLYVIARDHVLQARQKLTQIKDSYEAEAKVFQAKQVSRPRRGKRPRS